MPHKTGKDPRKKWSPEHRANFMATQSAMRAAGNWGTLKGKKLKKSKPNGHGGHRDAAHTPEATVKRLASLARTNAEKRAAKNGAIEVVESEGTTFPLDSFPFPAPHRIKRGTAKKHPVPVVHAIPLQTIVSDGDKLLLVNKLADLFNKLLA